MIWYWTSFHTAQVNKAQGSHYKTGLPELRQQG